MCDVLGLPLPEALALLREQGIHPEVRLTCAPRGREQGQARVVCVAKEGRLLVCARFLDPLTPANTTCERAGSVIPLFDTNLQAEGSEPGRDA